MATQMQNPATEVQSKARMAPFIPGTFSRAPAYPGERPVGEEKIVDANGREHTRWSLDMGNYLLSMVCHPRYVVTVGYSVVRGPNMPGAGCRVMQVLKVFSWDVPAALAQLDADLADDLAYGFELIVSPRVIPKVSDRVRKGLETSYFCVSNGLRCELDRDRLLAHIREAMKAEEVA